MRIRLFFIASFIYIALIFALAWYLELGNYTLNFNAYSFELPIMIWLILPLIPLVFFAIIHMGFYYFLLTLKFKHFFKDSTKFENFTRDLLLEKESNISFQTKEFRQVAQLAKTLKTHEKIPNANKINEILDLIDGIKKEEYFNLNKFKLENNNILFLENEKNHIKNDINYAYSKIKNLSQTQDEFQDLAFESLIKKGTYEQIKNIKITKKPCHILTLIKRFKEGNLELNAAEYEVLLSHNILSEKDYLDIAKLSIKLLNPDAVIEIFNKIKNEKSEALRAYLYLLAEFGLLDELREQIHNDDKKFNDFKAFLALREKNIKIDLNQLIQ
ncbi:hypothetical protein M3L00_000302 [Campylobacter coli]|nr:hypothetical protein [Campylobacter coli]EJE0111103.1 hypothetical protein [Campylobacter coli]EKC9915347.1 hypothetical protein [Campylobacter coli]ELH7404919.1 hypothetical protein [Campylobacter coli]MHD68953.1 hypothetical protein [Campylobacter coli]